jgi:hypothetical protein
MSGAIPPLPQYAFWRSAQLKKHRDKFTFTFTCDFDNKQVAVNMCLVE